MDKRSADQNSHTSQRRGTVDILHTVGGSALHAVGRRYRLHLHTLIAEANGDRDSSSADNGELVRKWQMTLLFHREARYQRCQEGCANDRSDYRSSDFAFVVRLLLRHDEIRTRDRRRHAGPVFGLAVLRAVRAGGTLEGAVRVVAYIRRCAIIGSLETLIDIDARVV